MRGFDPVEPPAQDQQLASMAAQYGVEGIVDLHVHLLPVRLQQRIWEHFDAAGPMLGRPWPIRYRWAVPDLVEHLHAMGVRRFGTMPYLSLIHISEPTRR